MADTVNLFYLSHASFKKKLPKVELHKNSCRNIVKALSNVYQLNNESPR